jgi:hypothetical protein
MLLKSKAGKMLRREMREEEGRKVLKWAKKVDLHISTICDARLHENETAVLSEQKRIPLGELLIYEIPTSVDIFC